MTSGVYKRKTVKERLLSKVQMIPEGGCWVWMGYIMPKGYGQIGVGYTVELTHRVSYKLFKGDIPDGLVVDHLCNNPCCVNPSHLEAVTSGENIARTYRRGIKIYWRKLLTHCKRGHEFNTENTYIMKNGGRSCNECRRMRKRGEV